MKRIVTFGSSRAKVYVTVEGDLVRVRWRSNGQRKLKSYPNTPENRANAKAFAKGVAESREAPTQKAPLTLRTLYERYADAEYPHLRPNSQRLYREYYSRWENAWGIHFPVEATTLDMAHEFRKNLSNIGLATSTIKQTIRTVQMVYSWGERNELIVRNKMRLYRFKVGKDDRIESPAEYSDEELLKLLAALDPKSSTQWRAWVALAICGAQGVRQHAVLHLKWADFADENTVIWRREWDKLGREWSQPLRTLAKEALMIALYWRGMSGYQGDWILPSGSSKNKGETYSSQSLWTALREAETRAGITHLKGRAAHGLRRLLAGNVAALTGDAVLAMHSIGDTDVRMANRYVKKRDERIADVFEELDSRSRPEASNGIDNETTTQESEEALTA